MPSSTETPTAATMARIQLPVTRREAVVAQLRDAIIAGELKPGALLKDAELAVQLGLSATPVREALMQLAAEGLIEIEPNRLKRVAPIDLDAMIELLEVQTRLWAFGYAWGAPRINSAELAKLRHIYSEHAEAIAYNNTAAAVTAALAFHREMMIASGNRELVRVSMDRLSLIQRFVRLRAPHLISPQMLGKHRDIIIALEQGDITKTLSVYEETSTVLLDAARALRKQENHEPT